MDHLLEFAVPTCSLCYKKIPNFCGAMIFVKFVDVILRLSLKLPLNLSETEHCIRIDHGLPNFFYLGPGVENDENDKRRPHNRSAQYLKVTGKALRKRCLKMKEVWKNTKTETNSNTKLTLCASLRNS